MGEQIVKERPILFSAPMVRAILDGRKTQTRRVVKDQGYSPQPTCWCPFGKPGDRLWVREAWGLMNACYGKGGNWVTVGYRASDGGLKETDLGFEIPVPEATAKWAYEAFTDEAPKDEDGTFREGDGFEVFRWRSPIHMPRWASRITLEVIRVRVERVQEIIVGDVAAEGVEIIRDAAGKLYIQVTGASPLPYMEGAIEKGTLRILDPDRFVRAHFAALWDSLNAKRGHLPRVTMNKQKRRLDGLYGWAANPWVWVVEFKRVEA